MIGDVVIQDGCFVGAGAIVRGDYSSIRIGARTALEEGCIIHCPPGEVCEIGNDVTLGHGAIIHCSKIGDFAVIGMGAIVSIHALIGEWDMVGEGAVIVQGSSIPPRKVVVGNPAKIIKETTEEQMRFWSEIKEIYVDLCRRYREGLERVG